MQDASEAEGSAPLVTRVRIWLFGIVALLSLGTLLLLSSVRMIVPIGVEDGPFSRVVPAVLGVSLPLISAFFFIRGFQTFGRRWEILSKKIQLTVYERWTRYLEERESSYRESNEDTKAEAAVLTDGSVASLEIKTANEGAFYYGYATGLSEILREGHDSPLYDALQKVALRNALMKRDAVAKLNEG